MIIFGVAVGLALVVGVSALAFFLVAIFDPFELNDEDIWKD